MKLAYGTNAYTKHSLEYAIRSIANIGFDGVEILCDRPHWYPPKSAADELAKLVTLIQETKLGVSNINANTADGFFEARTPLTAFEPSLDNADANIRQQRIQYSKAAIDLAIAVGAKNISVSSGVLRDPAERSTAIKRFANSLKEICDYATSRNMRVGIEYEPGLTVELADQVLEVVELVGSPLLGVNFDIGHSFLNGEDPAATTRSLAGRIWNVHVEDIKDNVHFHLIPGDGELPFDTYFSTLQDIGYNGYLSVELYTFADRPEYAGERSLAYLGESAGHL